MTERWAYCGICRRWYYCATALPLPLPECPVCKSPPISSRLEEPDSVEPLTT